MLIYDGKTKLEKQMKDNYTLTISGSPRFLSYIYSKKYFNYRKMSKKKHDALACG
jgi:hypothetical protein